MVIGTKRSSNRPKESDRNKYLEVQVDTLRLNSTLPFRLFTYLESEFLLYRREKLPFTQTQRKALLDNGIDILYVAPEEVDSYWTYLRDVIKNLLDDPTVGPERKCQTFYESSASVAQQLIRTPIHYNTLTTAKTLVSQSIRLQHEGKKALHSLMSAMASMPTIYTHSLNVCQFGLALAKHYQMAQSDLESLGLGLLFMDLGMLEIPESLLFKSGPLSFEEWDLIKKHPALGLAAVDKVQMVPELARSVIFSHHERLDGTGYPQGLIEDEINFSVRIAMIADIFSSMTTSRQFRTAYSTYDALKTMTVDMNGQLDRDILKTFIQILGR